MESRRILRPTVYFAASAAILFLAVSCLWILRFERHVMVPVDLAAGVASDSAPVRQLLGAPLKIGRFARGNLVANGGNGTADLTIRIGGPLGNGTLSEWAQESDGKWEICSLFFRLKGGKPSIPLVSDSSTNCERE
jgi:hypothetical protein